MPTVELEPTAYKGVYRDPVTGRFYFRGIVGGYRLDKLSLKTTSYKKAILAARRLVSIHDLTALKEAIDNLVILGTRIEIEEAS